MAVATRSRKSNVKSNVTKMIDPRKASRGPGRPPVFKKGQRRTVASYLRKHGLTGGLALVATERGIVMSIPTATKIAELAGIVFTRGRRPL